MSKPIRKLCVAALSILVKPGAEIQLLPAGEFRARDGRPEKIGSWNCSAEIAKGVIALAAARQTPLVIDYEHQTLLSEKNGLPAPAAGWFKTLEWREGDGLYATDVEWTDKARAMIEAKEYLYLSPVFSFDPSTGAVLQINHAALTNVPALDGMAEVAVMSAYAHRFSDQPNHEETNMDLQLRLLAVLGLAATATADEALTAVTALKTKAEQTTSLESQVAALKTANPDPAKFVSVDTMKALQGEVAALSTKLNTQELDTVITDALTAGKLLPPQEAWARALGGKDLASLKEYVANAVAIAPGKQQTNGKEVGAGAVDGALSEEQRAVCKALGFSEDEFKKSLTTTTA